MAKLTKKQKDAFAKFDKEKFYSLEEAVKVVKNITFTKFDSSCGVFLCKYLIITCNKFC